jgi:hypothetical protein
VPDTFGGKRVMVDVDNSGRVSTWERSFESTYVNDGFSLSGYGTCQVVGVTKDSRQTRYPTRMSIGDVVGKDCKRVHPSKIASSPLNSPSSQ